MRVSWVRSVFRAVNRGQFRCFHSIAPTEIFMYRCCSLELRVRGAYNSAQRLESNSNLHRVFTEVNDINSRKTSRRVFSDEKLRRCTWRLESASFLPLSRHTPAPQLDRPGFRSCFYSVEAHDRNRMNECGQSLDSSLKGQLVKENSKVAGVESWKKGDAVQNLQMFEGAKRRVRGRSTVVPQRKIGSEPDGRLAFDGEEAWGNVPKKTVSEDKVLAVCKALIELPNGRSELSPCGEENVRLLLALGGDADQVVLLFRKHPELQDDRVASVLLASARMFHDFGMDATLLLHVLTRFCAGRRINIFIRSTSDEPGQVLRFLRDEIGVKRLDKVVSRFPELLKSAVPSIKERLSTLRSLGLVVNGDFVEKFPPALARSPASLRKTAAALESALGPGMFQKNPLLLFVNADSVPNRVANLRSVVGEDMSARDLLVAQPTILMSREETVRETWCGLVEIFSRDVVMRSVQSSPRILCCNWNTFRPKIEYLLDRGFSRGDMVTCISMITIGSLERHIRPRVEIALGSRTVYEGNLALGTILGLPVSRFEKRFNVSLSSRDP